MFSIDLIKKKVFKGRKKNSVKLPPIQKKKSKSFLPLETTSALFKENNSEIINNKTDACKKATDNGSWRYYTKLTQEAQPVINMDANFKVPTKRLKSNILKLHDNVDVVARQSKLKFRKKKEKSYKKETKKSNYRKIGSCSTLEIKENYKNENLDLLVGLVDKQENEIPTKEVEFSNRSLQNVFAKDYNKTLLIGTDHSEFKEIISSPGSMGELGGEETIVQNPIIDEKKVCKKRKKNQKKIAKNSQESTEVNVILDQNKKIKTKLYIKSKNKKHKETNELNLSLANNSDTEINMKENDISELSNVETGMLNYPLKVVNIKNKKKSKIQLIETEEYLAPIEADISSLIIESDTNFAADICQNVARKTKLYYDALTLSEDSLLVALCPGTEFYFCGNVWLKLIVGSISVHGYTFMPGDLHPIFSPPSHSLQSIKVLEGKKIKKLSLPVVEDLDIPDDWIQQMNIDENIHVAIVKLCRFDNSSTRLLEASQLFHINHFQIGSDKLFEDKLGIHIIDQDIDTIKNCLKQEPPSWNLYANSILQIIPNDPRIVIAGGKGVGKSTFFTYLINRLLSNHSVDHVACVDLDPGQPEFALPSVLSITKITDPVLGPAYTRLNGMNLIDQTQIVVGDMDVSNILQEYLSIVKRLEYIYNKKYYNMPLIINTMGFTARIGLDIMVDVLRIFNPSHVIVIESPNPKLNYAYSIRSSFVNSCNRGVLEKISSRPLSYEFKSMKAFSSHAPKTPNIKLRDLRILSYLSKLWKDDELEFIGLNCKNIIKVPWSSIAIHVVGSNVPHEHLLDTINATLVALCKVKEEYLEDYLEDIESNFPRQIKKDSHWHHASTCLGWGVIQGIDPVTKEINILTPLNEELLMLEVNVLVLTKACLPVYFSKLFSSRTGPYMKKNSNSKSHKNLPYRKKNYNSKSHKNFN